MNIMLTDPDVLADYVNDFFGPEGPYPTETPEETAQREQYEARAQFEVPWNRWNRVRTLAAVVSVSALLLLQGLL